jgi:cyanophycinase-like exopeptidase
MRLYLFGGYEHSEREFNDFKLLLKETILSINPKSILHIPFADLKGTKEGTNIEWFKELMAELGIKVYDARSKEDIDTTDGKYIFINGGHERDNLLTKINSNPKLLKLVMDAECIIAESSGSMAIGDKLRRYSASESDEIFEGLGILKGVIIEPHYTTKNTEQLLTDELKKSGLDYGIGIDSSTGMVVDSNEFPFNWEKIGFGDVYIIKAV